ncbi:hypothetical protein D3C71_2027850 [compost metagenome]
MGGRFGEVKTGQRHKRQGIKRTGTRPEEAIVKTDAAACNQGKRQTVQTTLTILFP